MEKKNNIPFKIRLKWKMQELYYYIMPYKLLKLRGYIDKNGTPIKCRICKSKEITETNHQFGGWNIPEGCLTEYDVICKKCGAVCGHWEFGSWEIL